ncbi:cytochrome c1 [Thiohalorhabdus sp. Cl-TMA]|uniref:Cytochrome c1 n=1 Tax=Thiohalorhabdus methylotrophus TaxID=3242694 RepID=A0ABV4TXN4_9GAMM
MKNWIAAIVMGFVALPGLAQAAGGEADLMHMEVDYSKETLRDGAKTFMNNCLGCHSAKYYRLKNLVDDLGMSKTMVEDKLMYGLTDVNQHMMSAMSQEQGTDWFGAAPPDLSLTSRVQGTDWIYTYLLRFYKDDGAATGWNNHVFPEVSMPNVLYHMTEQAPGYYAAMPKPHHGEGEAEYPEVPEKLDQKVQNLVSFMAYLGDPSVLARHSMGPWVLLFLAVLGVLTYLVKKEYWRDIH